MTEDTAVTLVTNTRQSRYAAVEGSPLEGLSNLSRIDLGDSWITGRKGGVPQPVSDESMDVSAYDRALNTAQALVVAPWMFPPPFTEARWREAPELRVIAGTFDNRFDGWLDVVEAQRRGVTVIDTSRSMTPSVAEFALAMTLNLLRDIPAAVQLVREGSWKDPFGWDQPDFLYGDLTGRKVGLAGYGSINRRYVELLAPFDCSIRAVDPFVSTAELHQAGIEQVDSLTDLASESEVFVIGIPPTPATQGIINRDVIYALPRGASVVIVTRMAVIEQEALWQRAESGEIRVAVDVFDPEPPPADASFRTSPFVLPTPHIAGDAALYHRRCFTTACADALTVLAGGQPKYGVSRRDDLLYRGTPQAAAENG